MHKFTYTSKTFGQLTTLELYDVLKIRQEVFIVEQDCPYLDADGKDLDAIHIIATDQNSQIVGYTRVLAPGISYNTYSSIGRVVNAQNVRGQGVGRGVMLESIRICKEQFPNSKIKISAQTYLDGFYKSLGFVATGEYYLEDDIPHQGMIM